jgi:predicted Zn-dependent protease
MNVLRLILYATCVLVGGALFASAQDRLSDDKLNEQARHEYSEGKFADAERDFRELTERVPSNIDAQVLLGQAQFKQRKYALAVASYESARSLEKSGTRLSLEQHRILVDQLAMAYGISGHLKKARALLEDAVRQDPNYPLNYYNLACTLAEEGDKEKVLENLSLAFQHKDKLVKGETMPDPRTDSSFQKYRQDDDFIKLMKNIGYE